MIQGHPGFAHSEGQVEAGLAGVEGGERKGGRTA